jgi:hypothetical protein
MPAEAATRSAAARPAARSPVVAPRLAKERHFSKRSRSVSVMAGLRNFFDAAECLMEEEGAFDAVFLRESHEY